MPSANVRLPEQLTRLNPVYPGQLGVSGTSNDEGLRMHSTARVLYVDPNFVGVSDLRDGSDPTCPLESIAAALTKCRDFRGDTIYVMHNDAWQFGPRSTDYNTPIEESVVVTVHGVRIVGVAPSSSLGPLWKPATSGGVACTVDALDVLIEGFCFSGATEGAAVGGTAILVEWDGITVWGENLVVRNCFFDGSVDVGIQLDYSWNCWIYDNEFQGCDTAGIYADPADSPMALCKIHDNIFRDCGIAMDITEANECEIYRNSIFNTAAQGGGAATGEGIDTGLGGQNQIFDNAFSCILPAASPGDWDDLNTGDATDAWVNNHCMNGMAITIPT